MNWLVKGSRIVSPADGLDGLLDVLIADGRVARVGEEIVADAKVVDARGLLLLPGLVDLHAHFGEPGLENRESIATGSAAAARGGYTTVLMMPDTDPPLDSPSAVFGAVTQAAHQAKIRLLVAGALTKALAGEAMPELAGMVDAGAAAFVQPDSSVKNSGLLRRILQYVRGMVPLVAVRPYDSTLAEDGLMHEGQASTVYGIKGMPAVAEEIGVARELLLAEETGCQLHLSGISTAKALHLVARAKAAGVRVTCAVSPHHLVFTDECLEGYDPNCKIMPPLRPVADVQALIEGLVSGTIDCVATDHTPLTAEEKDVEFGLAPWGAVGLETTLPALFTYLVLPGHITLSHLVTALSARPARLLGLGDRAGTVAPGAPADFVLVDPDAEKTVEPTSLLSRGKNTPLVGHALKGWPVATFVGGTCIWGAIS